MRLSYATPEDPWLRRTVIRSIESLTGAGSLQRLYEALPEMPQRELWQAMLDALEIELRLSGSPPERAPEHGPLVLVANHPFGVVDGLALCVVAARLRPEFRIMVNSVLCRDERVLGSFLPIDFSETKEALRVNLDSQRRAFEILERGGALGIFPAGGIATSPGWFGDAEDLEWKTSVAKLVRATRASVLPLHFPGQNARVFQIVSHFSLTLRLALLLREVHRRRGRPLEVSVGKPIPWSALEPLNDREALTSRLRAAVLELAAGGAGEDSCCLDVDVRAE